MADVEVEDLKNISMSSIFFSELDPIIKWSHRLYYIGINIYVH